ncbi:MAG: hypothetical protein INQ03_08920 [Candidatus Heimdallarchaeota archaeon]|nr:hypothetical protein [Candidatus Heimdallarchaeota archaeon]
MLADLQRTYKPQKTTQYYDHPDDGTISFLRKELRLLREEAMRLQIPLTITVNGNCCRDTNPFWSSTHHHSRIDDLYQMQCNGGENAFELEIVITEDEPSMMECQSTIDYDAIYLQC